MDITSLKEAKSLGLNHYFTGEPCKYGHVSMRSVGTRSCMECSRIRTAKKYALLTDEEKRAISSARAEYLADYYVKNIDQHKKLAAEWNEKNVERVKKLQKNWYLAHRDQILDRLREEYASNPAPKRKYCKVWRKKNPEEYRRQVQSRRDAKNGLRLSRGIVKKLIELQRGKCPACGKPLHGSYHIDHIVPLAKGGTNTDDNVQLLHPRCNMKKSAKDPIEFMQQQGFLL